MLRTLALVGAVQCALLAYMPHANAQAATATVVGVRRDPGGEPELVVRFVDGSGATRTPTVPTFALDSGRVTLAERGPVTPLAATGTTTSVVLVIEQGGDPSTATRWSEALLSAVRSTFNPGDEFAVAKLTAGGGGWTPTLAGPTRDLAVVEGSLAQSGGPNPSAARPGLLAALASLAERQAHVGAHTELIVLAGAGTPGVDLDAIVLRLQTTQTPVSAMIVLPDDATIDALSAAADDDALCVLARRTGGVCRVTTLGNEQALASLGRVVAEAQSLFAVPVGCVDAAVMPQTPSVSAVGSAPGSATFPVDPGMLRCRTAPPTTPPSVAAAGSGGATVPPAPSEGSSAGADAAVAAGVPAAAWAVGGGVLLLAIGGMIVALIARRRRGLRIALDDVEERVPVSHERTKVTAFDALAPNLGAHVLTDRGPVSARPDWLRDPGVLSTRSGVRRFGSRTEGTHLVWASNEVVSEAPLHGPVLVGNSSDCDLLTPSLPSGSVALRLAPVSPGVAKVQRIDPTLAVELNGSRCPDEITLRTGDELVVGGATVIELRMSSADGAIPAFSPHNRRATRRLRPSDNRSFAPISLNETTVLLGRDPMPYRGVEAVPSRLVIAQISNDHAEIWISGGVVFVRDLGSSNGTFVDGTRLLPFVVTPVAPQQTLALSALVTLVLE